MTPYNGPRTEAGDTWPPAIERSDGSVPTNAPDTGQRDLRRGRFALSSALTGIGLAVLGLATLQTGWVRAALLTESIPVVVAYYVACFLGLICEVVAVITGSVARRTRTGQWGLALSLLSLVLTAVFLYASLVYIRENSNDNCCHEKMGPNG